MLVAKVKWPCNLDANKFRKQFRQMEVVGYSVRTKHTALEKIIMSNKLGRIGLNENKLK